MYNNLFTLIINQNIGFIPLELLTNYENLSNLDENQDCNPESDRNQLDRTFVI